MKNLKTKLAVLALACAVALAGLEGCGARNGQQVIDDNLDVITSGVNLTSVALCSKFLRKKLDEGIERQRVQASLSALADVFDKGATPQDLATHIAAIDPEVAPLAQPISDFVTALVDSLLPNQPEEVQQEVYFAALAGVARSCALGLDLDLSSWEPASDYELEHAFRRQVLQIIEARACGSGEAIQAGGS